MFGRRKKSYSPLSTYGDGWDVLGGSPLFVRIRTSFADAAGHPDHPVQLGIAVPLNDPTDDGLPAETEDGQLQHIKDALDSALAGDAELVTVLTTSGMREFVFYARDLPRQHFVDIVTAVNSGIDTHTLQLMIQDDPTWSVYTSYLP